MLLYIHRRYPINYFDITVILMLWLLCFKTQSNNLQGNRALIGTEVLGEPPRRIAFPTNCTWIHTYSISLHTVYIYIQYTYNFLHILMQSTLYSILSGYAWIYKYIYGYKWCTLSFSIRCIHEYTFHEWLHIYMYICIYTDLFVWKLYSQGKWWSEQIIGETKRNHHIFTSWNYP